MPSPDRLPARPPFAREHLLSWLAARAIPGVEAVLDGTYARTTQDGSIVTLTPAAGHVDLAIDGGADAITARLLARRMLDLDADPVRVDAALAADPHLAPLIAARPGLRVPGAWDGFELAVRAILGQQISVAAASKLAGRVVALCGTPLERPRDGLTHRFPEPAQLAHAARSIDFMPAPRARALRVLAEATADGRIDLSPGADPGAARAALLALPGIGPWTVEYVAMRALREPDAFPSADLVLLRAMRGDPRRAERWRPWRAYAAMHLWADAAARTGSATGTRTAA